MPPLKRTYIIFFAAMLCGTVGLVLMTVRYNQLFQRTSGSVKRTLAVLDLTQQIRMDLSDARRGQATTLPGDLQTLKLLVADNPLQVNRIDSLTTALARKDDLARRGLLLRIQAEEYRLLHLRQTADDHTRDRLRNAIFVLLALIFSLLCFCAYLVLYHFNRRRKAEQVLKESQSHFDLLVRNVRDYAIFKLDVEGRVMSWNEGAGHIKGYSEKEVLGQSIAIFYPEEEIENGEPAFNLQKAAAEGRFESIGRRKRKDGTLFWADVVFTAMRDAQGELTGYIKITKDISEQHRVQDEMRLALDRERLLNEMKSRFVTLASHEFKTPLSVILSSVSLIEKYNTPETEDKRQRHIQRVRSNVDNLKHLLNDFLSLEKLEEGVVRNNPEQADLVQLVEEGIQDMIETCDGRRQMIFGATGTPRPVSVDPHLLRNILNNLLSNATKYSPPDAPVNITLEFDVQQVRLKIADEGIGIPVEEQQHLFERFFRARNTTGISGTGLGLSIVKRYLDLMGGSIAVDSSADHGTTFSVTFPAPVLSFAFSK